MPKDSKKKGKKLKHYHNPSVNKRKLLLSSSLETSNNLKHNPAAFVSQKENITSTNLPVPATNDLDPSKDIEIIDGRLPNNLPDEPTIPLVTLNNFIDKLDTVNDPEDNNIAKLFDKIRYSEEATSVLPNRSWAIHCTDVPVKRIVVSDIIMENLPGRGLEPIYTKQIVFDDKLNFELLLLTSKTTLKDKPSSIQSMADFESLLDHVDSLKLCKGGPDVVRYHNVNPECAYKDLKNKWRHNLCTLEINDGDTCEACLSLEDILKRHIQRLKPSIKCRSTSHMIRRKRPGQSRGS